DANTVELLWQGFLADLKRPCGRSWHRGSAPAFSEVRTEAEVLVAVGDHQGDLYDRAWKQLVGEMLLAAEVAGKSVEQHVEKLGSPVAAEREAATRAVTETGGPAWPLLERAAKTSENAALRRQAEALLRAMK